MPLNVLHPPAVLPGLGPGIHDFPGASAQVVGGRAKPGHDGGEVGAKGGGRYSNFAPSSWMKPSPVV